MPLPLGENLPIYKPVAYKNYNDIWFYSMEANAYINILENKFYENMIGVHYHKVVFYEDDFYYKGIQNEMTVLKNHLVKVENKRKISLLYAEVAKSLLLGELK